MSCKKAWGALNQKQIVIQEEVNATTNTIKGAAIWELVKNADKVVVASGKKIIEFDPKLRKEGMLAKISGRTGNLRAPSLRCKNTFYIGFNEDLYSTTIE